MAGGNIVRTESVAASTAAMFVDDVTAAIQAMLARAGSANLSDLEAEIKDIAYRVSLYGARKALGENVDENLREVRLQAGLVEATILRRESEAAAAAWKTGIEIALDLVAGLLRRILTA